MTHNQTRVVWGTTLLVSFFAIIGFDIVYDSDLGLGLLGLLIGTAALLEFYEMVSKKGLNPLRLSGIAWGMVIFLYAWWKVRSTGAFYLDPLGLFGILLWLFILHGFTLGLAGAIGNIAVTFFGILYVFFPLSFVMALRHFPGKRGLATLIGIILMTKVTDIGAYFGGKHFGKHKLCPDISPNKTVEGAILGLLSCVIIGVGQCFVAQWGFLPMHWAAPFALLIGVGSISGDLFESMLKRDAGVKDSGNLIPTFGGALDIIDCVLFSLPMGYYSLVLLKMVGVQ